MPRHKSPDRICGITQLGNGRWRIRYMLGGKHRQTERATEIAARQKANEIQAQIDAMSARLAADVATAINVARVATHNAEVGEDSDWRRLLWAQATVVAADPQDEAAQRAGRVLADLARADLAVRRQQSSELGDGEARRLLEDPDLAARVDAMLAGDK